MRYWKYQIDVKELEDINEPSFDFKKFRPLLISRINNLKESMPDEMARANMDVIVGIINRATSLIEFKEALDWLTDACDAYGIFLMTK